MIEQDVMRRIMIAVSKVGARVFRNNTGRGWVGTPIFIKQARQMLLQPGDVVLRQARPLHAGLCLGSSDLVGIAPVVVRQEHVGKTLGVFTALEVKTATGRTTPEQVNFIEQIKSLGGIAGICRDTQDALQLIAKHSSPTAAPDRSGH